MNDSLRPTDSSTAARRYRVNYEAELNPEQLRVVMHPGGPMLALAGAGTGKTRTLVYRVSRLIEDGVPPVRILLLTFTNKASREMLKRVEDLIDLGGGRVTGGTFHSVGNRILRRYAEVLGFSPKFSILDREDSADLMGSALADISPDLPKRRLPGPSMLVNLYSFVINTGHDLETVVLDKAPQYLDQVEFMARVFKRYLERKRRADAMDFDDLLLNWLILLKRHPVVRKELAQRFEHLLVDEYQDTNRLQADIVDAMLGRQRNLMVVGDDAQSIYAFRGADFENILGFPERHPGCEVFRLETNYRSTPEILDMANASISMNARQFKKELNAIRTSGDKPLEIAAPDPEHQAKWLADQVLEMREEGIDLSDIGVLYRAHAHSLEIQVELTRRNIPYQVRSGMRFFEQRHVKDVLSHLRIIDNPRDEVAFSRMIKLRRGFGPRLTAKVWDKLSKGKSLRKFLRLSPSSLELPRSAVTSFTEVQNLIDNLNSPIMLSQPGEAIRLVVTRFYREFARNNLENSSARLDDLEQLALFADPYTDVAAFLSEMTLLNELSGEDVATAPPDEVLTLSTVHQSKGLEWSSVFVVWLADGRFPSFRADDDEEERRLFYVAITRAREQLFLLYPQIARDRHQVDLILHASRFLSELPVGFTERQVLESDNDDDFFDALPEGGRYELPSFLTDSDDDKKVN